MLFPIVTCIKIHEVDSSRTLIMQLNKIARPQYHFTPPENWMNDPNGLVYYKGEYHLFYQYHPDSIIWGPMHWGHAVSRDLINWEHLPVALYPDENGMIFSGSAVIDWENTAGFGKESMVAIFTHHKDGHQSQSLAYSLDAGRTWTKYANNPVIPAPDNLYDFRDPKVFWYEGHAGGHWVMCLTAKDKVLFYESQNLIRWSPCGQLGPGYGSTTGVWETPDLFELPIDGSSETRWVLTVGVQGGAPAGGSGTQYFVGKFDGKSFFPENPADFLLWVDFGADYYAAQSWSDAPDGRRIMLGWMSNWQYANVTPSTTWRGMLSLPRELSLTRTTAGNRLVQQPIPEMKNLRCEHRHWQQETLFSKKNLLSDFHGHSLEIHADFQVGQDCDDFGFRVRIGDNDETSITYNPGNQKIFLDRTRSGKSDFYSGFPCIHTADLSPVNGRLLIHIYIDQYSVEVFANNGLVTMSDSIFPSQRSLGIELFSNGGKLQLNNLDFYTLKNAKNLVDN
jgi:fructan beta-fructosidase